MLLWLLSLSSVGVIICDAVTSPVSNGWWVLGPFVTGTREHGADPTYDPYISSPNGVFDMFHANNDNSPFIPNNLDKQFPTELADGGYTNWTIVNGTINHNGNTVNAQVNVQFTNVRWDLIEQPIGQQGALFQGWAVTELQPDQTDSNGVFLLHCSGAGVIYVDDENGKVHGDPYQNGYMHGFP